MISIVLQPTLKRVSEISQRVFVDLNAKVFDNANKLRNNLAATIIYALHPHRDLPAQVVTTKRECSEPTLETEQNSPTQRDDRSDYLWLVLISDDKVNKWEVAISISNHSTQKAS
jgi:hypothetical protein